MLIDVLIPVFKYNWLDQTIKSVLNQSYTDFNLIMLSDGAPEKAIDIMKKYEKNPKIKLHFQKNKGVGIAEKRLIEELSNSKYFLIFDDDDILLKNALKEIVACFEQNPNAGAVHAGVETINEEGKLIGDLKIRTIRDAIIDENANVIGRFVPINLPKLKIDNDFIVNIAHSLYAFKREVYEKTEGWYGYPKYKFIGGYIDMFMKIDEIADILAISKVLYQRRINPLQHNLSISMQDKREMIIDFIRNAKKRS